MIDTLQTRTIRKCFFFTSYRAYYTYLLSMIKLFNYDCQLKQIIFSLNADKIPSNYSKIKPKI